MIYKCDKCSFSVDDAVSIMPQSMVEQHEYTKPGHIVNAVPEPKKIELIVCYEDKTWDTEILELDSYQEERLFNGPELNHDEFDKFCFELNQEVKYRKVVYIGLYCMDPGE